MTSDIFKKWLLDIDNKMSQDKQKIILFVNNCTSRRSYVIYKVKICYNYIFFAEYNKQTPINGPDINRDINL